MNTDASQNKLAMIGLVIKCSPLKWSCEPDEQAIFALPKVFAAMLKFSIRAFLGSNIDPNRAVEISLMHTGFIATASVLDLAKALKSMECMLVTLHLSNICEVTARDCGDTFFHHKSGPNFGPWESHLDQMTDFMRVLVDHISTPVVLPDPDPAVNEPTDRAEPPTLPKGP